MTSTVFVDQVGPVIAASWLNDVNAMTYTGQMQVTATAPTDGWYRTTTDDNLAVNSSVVMGFNRSTLAMTLNKPPGGGPHTIFGEVLLAGSDISLALLNAANQQYGQLWYQGGIFKLEAAGSSPMAFATGGFVRENISAAGNVSVNQPDSGAGHSSDGNAGPAYLARGVGSSEAFRTTADSGFISWYNTAGTVLTGYLQLSAGGASSLVIQVNQAFNILTNGIVRTIISAAGDLIQNVNTSPPSLATNGQMAFALTSDTNLRVSVRGLDGATRVANITLS